jgi:hypothetical protein
MEKENKVKVLSNVEFTQRGAGNSVIVECKMMLSELVFDEEGKLISITSRMETKKVTEFGVI